MISSSHNTLPVLLLVLCPLLPQSVALAGQDVKSSCFTYQGDYSSSFRQSALQLPRFSIRYELSRCC